MKVTLKRIILVVSFTIGIIIGISIGIHFGNLARQNDAVNKGFAKYEKGNFVWIDPVTFTRKLIYKKMIQNERKQRDYQIRIRETYRLTAERSK